MAHVLTLRQTARQGDLTSLRCVATAPWLASELGCDNDGTVSLEGSPCLQLRGGGLRRAVWQGHPVPTLVGPEGTRPARHMVGAQETAPQGTQGGRAGAGRSARDGRTGPTRRHPAPGTRRPRSAVSRGVSAPCLPGPVLPPWASPAAVTTPAPGAWCGLRGMTWPRAGLTLRHFRPRWAEVARGLGQASEPPRLAPVPRAGPRTPCS